jgi:muramidase (phage lysozyme)
MDLRKRVLVSIIGLTAVSLGAVGCSAPTDGAPDEPVNDAEEASSKLPTCAPARADGAVNRYEQALHDAIAFAEGTAGYSKDGYNVGFDFKLFWSCREFPNMVTCSNGLCSSAAGRYQFLNTTWRSIAGAINANSFEPNNQERGAEYLIRRTRRVSVPESRPMSATEFSLAMSKLSYEWASLPPGRYGQGYKSEATLRRVYCNHIKGGC